MGLALPLPGLIAPLLLLLESNDHHIGHTAVVAPASTSLIGNVVLASDGSGGATTATAAKRRYDSTWDLPNGSVRFDNPVRFPVDMTMTRDGMGWVASSEGNDAPSAATAASWIELWDPTFLGSGGSGAVFSFSTRRPDASPRTTDDNTADGRRIAIKVSWKRSAESVGRECGILRDLASVPHLERCVGGPVEYTHEAGRTMIALYPVMAASDRSHDDSNTSDLNGVSSGIPQRRSVTSVVETMVKMLHLGAYTIDVQPLVNVETGEVLFIDFTEANRISTPMSSADESSLVDFCGEMLALIPDSLRGLAVEALRTEMYGPNDEHTAELPGKVIDILESVWSE